MADYYTQFSCQLELSTQAEVDQALQIYTTFAKDLEADEGIGFLAEASDKPDTYHIWIHADDRGDPEQVIAYVQLCAQTLGLSGPWGFEWSLSCSQP